MFLGNQDPASYPTLSEPRPTKEAGKTSCRAKDGRWMTGTSKGQNVRDVRLPAPPEQSSLESWMLGKRARPVWGGAAETGREIPRRPPTPQFEAVMVKCDPCSGLWVSVMLVAFVAHSWLLLKRQQMVICVVQGAMGVQCVEKRPNRPIRPIRLCRLW